LKNFAVDPCLEDKGKLEETIASLETDLKNEKGKSSGLEAELENEKGKSSGLEAELENEKGKSSGLEAELEEVKKEICPGKGIWTVPSTVIYIFIK
jgi:chromosome segregation ATPase